MPSIVKLTLESNQYERNIKNAQKSLNDFTRSIGINMKSLSGMTLAAGAVTTALKVAKDAFNQSRDMVDEWGRTVQSAQQIYQGFLTSLNSGDFSGFISNMGRIQQAARSAYDAVSDLQLLNAFNAPNTQQARTNLTESIADYRSGTGSKENVKAAGEALKAELEVRRKAEEKAYREVINQEAAKIGVDSNKLYGLLTGSNQNFWDTLQDYNPRNFSKSVVKPSFGGATVAGAMSGVNFATRVGKAPGTDEELLSFFAANITPENLQKIQQYSVQAKQTAQEMASTDKMIARLLNGKEGKSGGSSGGGVALRTATNYAAGSIAAQEKLVAELTKKWKEAGAEVRDGYRVQLDEAKKTLQEMMNPTGPQVALTSGDITGVGGSVVGKDFMKVTGLSQEDMPKLLSPLQQINAEIERTQQLMEMSPTTDFYQQMKQHLIELQQQQREFTGETTNDGKNISKSWNSAASAISGVGRAITTIEDPTAKIIGMIAEAVATIALGFSQAIGKDVGEKGNVWYAIGAAAAGITAMISAISSIHSATGYAQGGIVDGKSYSGDNIPILANAGEIVLSKSMQNNLAANLQENGRNFNLSATISGEQIRLILNNNGRRTGRGEYVTTNFR